MKNFLLYLISYFFILSAHSQPLPCSQPEYRQFDFWLGEWEAFGANGQKAGDSRISLMLDSCTVFEEWTSASLQSGLRYAGKSFNTYNATTKQWQQTWVDNTGATNEYMLGRFDNNQMIFTSTSFKFNKDTFALRKMTFTDINANKLRQHGQISKDGGTIWVTEYDLEYRRKLSNAVVVVDSVLRAMEDAYNKADYKKIASYYAQHAKVVGRNTEISGQKEMLLYWESFRNMGGTWKLSNEKTERNGDQIWQKGKSVITDKEGRQHKVGFTLIFIQEAGVWKILQDAYW